VAEKPTHKRVIAREGGRLDAATRRRAIEVETSGRPARLTHAATKLKASGKRQHVLVVPERDMQKAREAMRQARVTGTVRNLSGTKSRRVPASKARPSGHGKAAPSRKAPRGR